MKQFIPFRLLFPALLCCIGLSASAQFQTAYIGVNGLTCSQCSKTVELSIRKVDFVADVKMNLQHTEGVITLKKDKKADMEKIAQAIINAGFSVRYLQADLLVNSSVTGSGNCYFYGGDSYTFADAPKWPLGGVVKMKFLGKKYMPKNELKKVETALGFKCAGGMGKSYHVAMAQ